MPDSTSAAEAVHGSPILTQNERLSVVGHGLLNQGSFWDANLAQNRNDAATTMYKLVPGPLQKRLIAGDTGSANLHPNTNSHPVHYDQQLFRDRLQSAASIHTQADQNIDSRNASPPLTLAQIAAITARTERYSPLARWERETPKEQPWCGFRTD
jgi:hypothetical protein